MVRLGRTSKSRTIGETLCTGQTGEAEGMVLDLPLGVWALFNLLNPPSKKLYGLSLDIQAGILKVQSGAAELR